MQNDTYITFIEVDPNRGITYQNPLLNLPVQDTMIKAESLYGRTNVYRRGSVKITTRNNSYYDFSQDRTKYWDGNKYV